MIGQQTQKLRFHRRVGSFCVCSPQGSNLTGVTGAAGIGLATLASDGSVLDTWFPAPELTDSDTSATSRLATSDVPPELAALVGRDDERGTETIAVRTVIGSLDDVAADAYDAYLRLHLLSHRLVAPHGLNAGGLFGVLTNVVWTNRGPCAVEGFEAVRARLRRHGPVTVYGVDKFPRMVDYVLPTGVRIADAAALGRDPRSVFRRRPATVGGRPGASSAPEGHSARPSQHARKLRTRLMNSPRRS